jgi:hypothetical protein
MIGMPSWRDGNNHEAERLIKLKDDHIDLTEDPPGLKLAVDILGEIDAKKYQPVLEQNAPPVAPGRAAAALQHIASVDPQRALDLYSDGMEGITELQLSLLRGLRGNCLDDGREILGQLAETTYDHNQGKSLSVDPDPKRAAWWAALARTRCSLPSEIFIKIYDNEVYRDNDRDFNVMFYMLKNHDLKVIEWIRNDFARQVTVELSGSKSNDWRVDFERQLRLWSDMRILAAMEAPVDNYLTVKLIELKEDKDVKIGACRLLLTNASFDKTILLKKSRNDLWILALLLDRGWFDEQILQDAIRWSIKRSKPDVGSDFGDSLKYLMKMIRRRHVTAAKNIVKEIGETAPRSDVRVEASITLDEIDHSDALQSENKSKRAKYFSLPTGNKIFTLPNQASKVLLGDSYRFYVSDYDQGFTDAMSTFGTSVWDDARFFGRTPLSIVGLDELHYFLSDSSRRLSAAAVLAMRSSKQELQTLLSSPDIELRQEALKYAVYNPAIQEILASHTLINPTRQTQFYLTRQLGLKSLIEEALSSEPLTTRGLLLKILIAGSANVSPGLELWAADVSESLDGRGEDDAGEVALFDAH